MSERIKKVLDAVTDVIFAYRPAKKGGAVKTTKRLIEKQKNSDRQSSI